jgi:mannose/fructose/N-acetylgalactosamine-specific phosphotransferase system component IID
VNPAPNRISSWTLVRIALGSLFLQAAFEPERRQALGFAAALRPLEGRFRRGEDRARFHRRHLETINTNPALAGCLLGAVARLEEEAADGDERAIARVRRLKSSLQAPLAARGDALLWAGLRPVAALLGSVLALFAGGWGVLFFLLLYSGVQLGLRLGGVFWGYRKGEEIHALLRWPWLGVALRVLPPALGAAGAVLVASLVGTPGAAVIAVGAAAAGLFAGRTGFLHGTRLALAGIILGLSWTWVLSGNP